MKFFEFGSEVRFTETFTNLITGAVADPTTITLRLRDPSGTETSVTYAGGQIVRDSLGVYHYDFTPPASKVWAARWVATGSIVAADEFQFKILPSGFTNP